MVTGAPVSPTEYRALNPHGKAVIKAAEYLPPHEPVSEDFPFQLITGRTLYHFHTRTKTGRAAQLQRAAPDVWVEASASDAAERGWTEGDVLRVSTPRGEVTAKLRITGVRRGVLFLPFHYGYWDRDGGPGAGGHTRAANELTITDWDPASKQPLFKTAAAAAERIAGADGAPSPAPTTTASRPVADGVVGTVGGPDARADEAPAHGGDPVKPTITAALPAWAAALRDGEGNKVGVVMAALHSAETELGQELVALSDRHEDDHEIFHVARDIARWSDEHVRRLAETGDAYGVSLRHEPAEGADLISKVRQKGAELTGRRQETALLLLADLRRVHTMAAGVSVDWEVLAQAAQVMKDRQLLGLASDCHPQTLRQLRWANAKIKDSAAQIIVS
ncbi:hypothetical protein MF408_17615 [Nocardioides sp. TF02-7]|nr:hypothetical protein MF408_17615 [Nocardioides sp. TF02-7]